MGHMHKHAVSGVIDTCPLRKDAPKVHIWLPMLAPCWIAFQLVFSTDIIRTVLTPRPTRQWATLYGMQGRA